MILAAGLGSRLAEITEHAPKALVDVGGITMLERAVRTVVAAGADRIIINISHHADQIEKFVRERDNFGVEVVLSREEPEPLETGGGILHAAPLFKREGPILIHNADVICGVDLRAMLSFHNSAKPLATLAVNHRQTSRYLLFDGQGLCGRFDRRTGHGAEVHTDCENVSQYAFAGVHIISPALLDEITERGTFSIIDVYLRLAGEGKRILAYDMGSCLWLDVGTPERLAKARAWAEKETRV